MKMIAGRSTCMVAWVASWTSQGGFFFFFFFTEYCFYLQEWLTNSTYSDLGIWLTFSWKRKSECATSSSHLLFVVKHKIWAFKPELELQKIVSFSISIFNDFADESEGSTNECDFFILCNQMCQPLEALHNSICRNFSSNKGKILQNCTWVRYSFKVQDRTMDFNVSEYKMSLHLLSGNTTYGVFGVVLKKDIHSCLQIY